MRLLLAPALLALLSATMHGQNAPPASAPTPAPARPLPSAAPLPSSVTPAAAAPLPDAVTLLRDVEQKQKEGEQILKEYTFRSVTVTDEIDGKGAVRKSETEEREFSVMDGVPLARLLRKNGHDLSAGEQAKEEARLQKEIATAKEKRAKAAEKGKQVDERGDDEISLSRILALGSFSHERRAIWAGRSTIVLDYAGTADAKTHSTFEKVFKDLTGTVYIDEATHGLAHFDARFPNTFRVGGGLIASVSSGTHFAYTASLVNGEIWLPAELTGEGSFRFLLLVHFNGRMRSTFSGYRKFHVSGRVLPGVIQPPPESDSHGDKPSSSPQ